MSAVIPFLRPVARSDSWSQQELAEFYRVEAALQRAGIGIASEYGVSDEGEPWFVFCRPDGDAIMHFARTDGSYLIASEVLAHPVRGADFRALIDQIARLHPNLLPIPALASGTKLVVHPAALLAALVAAAALSLSSGEAHAGELGLDAESLSGHTTSGGEAAAHGRAQPASAKDAAGSADRDDGRKQIEAIIFATMMFAAEAVVGDHDAAASDLESLLANLAGHAGHPVAQAEMAPASGGGAESGPGGGGAIQSAVLTAQGSGAGQSSPAPSSPGDPASAIRLDSGPDKGGFSGREADHPAAGPGNEAGLIQAAADAGGAVGTAGPQTSATVHADASVGSSASTQSGSGDPRGSVSASPSAEASPPLKPMETAQSDAGTDPSSHGRGPLVRQAEASSAAASMSQENDDRSGNSHSGKKADAAASDTAETKGPDDSHGRAVERDAHTASAAPDAPGHSDDGPSHGKGGPGPGAGPKAIEPDKAAPGAPDDHRGKAIADAHASDGGSGPEASADGAGKGHGQGHDGTSPASAAAEGRGGPASEPDRAHGPSQDHGPKMASEPGNAHAAAPSPDAQHGRSAEASAHAAAPETAGSSPHSSSHPGSPDASPQADAGPTAHGPKPGPGDHGPASHEDNGPVAPDQAVAASPGHPAAHPGAGASEPAHADASPSAHAASATSPRGPDAAIHPAVGNPRQEPVSPAEPGPGHAAQHTAAPSPQAHQDPGGTSPGPSAQPRAAIDSNGNLVFHGGAHQAEPASTPSHDPGDATAHPSVGLVGVADHGPVVHDLYHHG